MRAILARTNRDVLEGFARSKLLLAFDYDGTLSPMSAQRHRAALRPTTRRLLARLARSYPCVLITGRTRGDAAARVRGIGLRAVLGNHGLEPWLVGRGLKQQVRGWRQQLELRLAGVPGIELEDKVFSLSVHYRAARNRRQARLSILRLARTVRGARVLEGDCVVNLVSRRLPDRGGALEAARARLGCDTALYVGDEEADEEVFALDAPQRILTIRVGERRSSRATYFIRGQREMDALLRRLLELRS